MKPPILNGRPRTRAIAQFGETANAKDFLATQLPRVPPLLDFTRLRVRHAGRRCDVLGSRPDAALPVFLKKKN